MPAYILTKASGLEPALEPGIKLTAGTLYTTNDSGVAEVRSDDGSQYKFGPESNFAVEMTDEGEVLVYGGEVWGAILRPPNGKYRTSCWLVGTCKGPWEFYARGSNSVDITKSADDIYTCLAGSFEIYEYIHGQRVGLISLRADETVRVAYTPGIEGVAAYEAQMIASENWITVSSQRRADLFGA